MPAVSTLQVILDAFNRHDVDAITAFFADDAVFDSPRGLGAAVGPTVSLRMTAE
jgi:hypothetical protein